LKQGFIRKSLKNWKEELKFHSLSKIESAIFMPVFFQEYYKNSQDSAAILKSLVEM
jgi:hypothetical protein